MSKKKNGKFIAYGVIAMALVGIVLFLLKPFGGNQKVTVVEKSYSSERENLGLGDNIFSLYVHNKEFYYVQSDNSKDEKKSIYVYSLEDSKETRIAYKLSAFSNLCDISIDDEGNYYLLEYTYSLPACESVKKLANYYQKVADGTKVHFDPFSQGVTEKYDIVKLNKNGQEIGRKNFFTTSSDKGDFTDYSTNYINIDKENQIYVVDSNNEIFVYNNQLEEVFRLKGDNSVYKELYQLADGTVGIKTIANDGTYRIVEIDSKKQNFGTTYEEMSGVGITTIMGRDSQYNLLYVADGKMKRFHYSNNESEYMDIDLVELGVSADDIKGIEQLDDGSYAIVHLRYGESGNSTVSITKINESKVTEEKIELVFGTYELSSNVEKMISNFNDKNDEYKVTVKEYSTYGEADALTKFQTDVMEGKIDFADVSQFNWKKLALQGVFEDLYEYMSTEEDYSKEKFNANLLETFELNDSLYAISPSYSLKTLFGKASDVGSDTGWTIEQYKKLQGQLKKNQVMIYGQERSDVLSDMLTSNLSNLIDYDKLTSHFDSEMFTDILEFASGIASEEELKKVTSTDSDENQFIQRLGDGDIKLSYFNLTPFDLQSMQVYEKIMGEEVNMVGYPSSLGSGSVFHTEHSFAILKNSKQKEIAWKFVKNLLSTEYQNAIVDEFPVRSDSCDSLLNLLSKEVLMASDENGEVVKGESSVWSYGELTTTIYPTSKHYVDMCQNLIDNTTVCDESDADIITIVLEESKDYFAGKKGQEAIIQIIQNRVTNYLYENYQ